MKYLIPLIQEHGGNVQSLMNQTTSDAWKDAEGHVKFPTNISVTSYDNLIINTRLTDYSYLPLAKPDHLQYIYAGHTDGMSCVSCNHIMRWPSKEGSVYRCESDSYYTMGIMHYKGLEDVRVVVWNDILYGIGSRPDVIPGKIMPQLIEYDYNLRPVRSWFLETDKSMEKNWQPIQDKPFTFMYDPGTDATITLDIDHLTQSSGMDKPEYLNKIDTPAFTGTLYGSTPLVHLPDGRYISLCHKGNQYTGIDMLHHWTYEHHLLVYNEDLQRIATSEPFHLIGDCMEFSCGMCLHGESIYITFTMYDGLPFLAEIPIHTLPDIIADLMGTGDGEPMKDMTSLIQEVSPLRYIQFVMYHECYGIRTPVERILASLTACREHKFLPDHIIRNVLTFLIVRRYDNEELIKYLNTL